MYGSLGMRSSRMNLTSTCWSIYILIHYVFFILERSCVCIGLCVHNSMDAEQVHRADLGLSETNTPKIGNFPFRTRNLLITCLVKQMQNCAGGYRLETYSNVPFGETYENLERYRED